MKPNIPWDAKIDYSKPILKDMPQGYITIPQGATNGDMMKKMFPWIYLSECLCEPRFILIHGIDNGSIAFDKEWWYAPYKISEVENEQTKR